MPMWEKMIADEGPNEENSICILSNPPKEIEILKSWALKAFGNRCVIDPDDNSDATRLLIAGDLERTLQSRGCYAEWLPHEIWTSNNARRWAEGLKKQLADCGHSYNPDILTVEACGQRWAGCLTKYSIFIPRYLGASKATDVNAALSPDAGCPIRAEFVERIAMDSNVWLFLFETADGLPMGQFTDGIRAVWEPPHIVSVKTDPGRVDTISISPNQYCKVNETARSFDDTIIMDVGDGCRASFTTLIAKDAKDMSFSKFRNALAAGSVSSIIVRNRVRYGVPYYDPITSSRD
jgi:hypothetical protein